MDFVPSLPVDVAAVAGPSDRGGAPLLRPTGPPRDAAAAPLPFDLFLALFAAPLPAGELWPPPGNELPFAAFAPAAAALETGASRPPAVAAPADDAALFARLRLVSAQPPRVVPTAPAAATALPLEDIQPFASPPLPPSTQAAVTAELLAHFASADSSAAPAPLTAETAGLDVAAAEQLVQDATAAAAEPASWLEALAAHDAQQKPATERAIETPRPTAPSPRDAWLSAAQRPVEAPPAVRETLRNLEATSASPSSTPALPDTSIATDWLPPAQGNSPAAASGAAGAAASAAVDLRAPNWQEAFAGRVHWLAANHAGEARIMLNPPELGAVDVKISLVDEKTYVQLTAATAAARDELAQSLPRLRELLAVSGLELGGASVHDGRDGQRAWQGHGHAHGAATAEPRLAARFAELADEPAAVVPRATLGRVDVFA